jgi:hypothetical protein
MKNSKTWSCFSEVKPIFFFSIVSIPTPERALKLRCQANSPQHSIPHAPNSQNQSKKKILGDKPGGVSWIISKTDISNTTLYGFDDQIGGWCPEVFVGEQRGDQQWRTKRPPAPASPPGFLFFF